jgi:hypothetical protein
MNLDHYILELLQEAAEKQLNLDPATVAFCFKKWNAELKAGVAEGVEATQLTKEQVEGAIRNFMQYIAGKNQFQFGFFSGGVYTLAYRSLIAKRANKPYLFQESGLDLNPDIINIRFSPLERILLTNQKVVQDLNLAIQQNQPKFSIGKFAKRDENGKVITKKNDKGKDVPVGEEDVFEYTKKGARFLNLATEKIERLAPFIEVLKDPKNYSLEDMKFILDQYNANTINQQANQIAREVEFTILPWSKDRGNKSKAEYDGGRNLVFSSPDNKIRIYVIKNQADAIRAGYFQSNVKDKWSDLSSRGLVSSDDHMGSQWCVTRAERNNSFYSGYRQYASYSDNKDYTFYLVINDNLNFYDLTDEELAEKPEDWKKLSKLKFYVNMFCIQPESHRGHQPGRVRVSDVTNPGEPYRDWSFIEQRFPGIEAGKEVLKSIPFEADEMIGGEESVGYNENSDSPRFLGAQSQAVKRAYIAGERQPGTIVNPEVWRSLDDISKKAYFEAADARNFRDMYKSAALFNEIKSNPQTYKDMIFYISVVHQIPNGLDVIKDNIIKNDYNEEPYRISDKNKNIVLLQKRTEPQFHLFNKNTMDYYESNGVDYTGDYLKDKTMLIIKADNESERFTAERFNRVRGANAEDTFWVIYSFKKLSYILTNEKFENLISDGVIHKAEKEVNGRINTRDVIDDPEELRRQQDIAEMLKGLR